MSYSQLLRSFSSASPQLLAERALQQRVDRKFLLPTAALPRLLTGLQCDYQVVCTEGDPAARYRSLYFDTAELDAFHDHRRGRRPRYKLRVRHHVDRRRSFFEIKRKGASGRTDKARSARPFGDHLLGANDAHFVREFCPFLIDHLRPTLWTNFFRATLVGVHTEERLTLDWSLSFVADSHAVDLPGVTIVEVKQARMDHQTPAVAACRGLGLRATSASKYCVAVIRLGLASRTQAFAPTLRGFERISS